jgi:hypothetical protein
MLKIQKPYRKICSLTSPISEQKSHEQTSQQYIPV